VNITRHPLTSAVVCALLLAFVGPVAAQGMYYPKMPAMPPKAPPNQSAPNQSAPNQSAPNQSALTTTPDRSKPSQQDNFLEPILRRIRMPQASGEVRVAPADAGVIVIHVPDADAEVLFDGDPSYTAGTTRTFVTPHLPDGETAEYKVAIRWKQGGDEVKKEMDVQARPGRITVVDWTRDAGK
jgi:uncharacterized protein (TIGR03000 family)